MKTLPRVYLVVTVLLLAGGWVVTMPRAAHAQPASCENPSGNIVTPNYNTGNDGNIGLSNIGSQVSITGHPCNYGYAHSILAEMSYPTLILPDFDEPFQHTVNDVVWVSFWHKTGGSYELPLEVKGVYSTFPGSAVTTSGNNINSNNQWTFSAVCVPGFDTNTGGADGSNIQLRRSVQYATSSQTIFVTGVSVVVVANSSCTIPTATPSPTITSTGTATATPGGVVGTPVAVTATPSGVLLPPAIPTYEPIELQPITPVPGVFFDTAPAELPSDEGYDFSGWGVPALPEAIPIAESEYAFE
jgi:hypothetical protein